MNKNIVCKKKSKGLNFAVFSRTFSSRFYLCKPFMKNDCENTHFYKKQIPQSCNRLIHLVNSLNTSKSVSANGVAINATPFFKFIQIAEK